MLKFIDICDMTTTKKTKDLKIISLRKLSKVSKIEYFKIRNNLIGTYDSMDDNEKAQLANVLVDELNPLFEFLGFEMKVKRL